MLRLVVPLVLMAALGCSRAKTTQDVAFEEIAFDSDEERARACTALRDHIVALYSDEVADDMGVPRDPAVRAKFREKWMQDLERHGNVHKFHESCAQGLTRNKFECGIQSKSTNELDVCMKLG